MRIAFLAGINCIHTVRWVNALVRRGHEVHLFTIHKKNDPVDGRVSILSLPFPAPWGYFFNAFRLRKLLQRIQPDLLNVHYASGYGTLGRLAGFKPTILSVWGSDVYDFPEKSPFHRWVIRKNLCIADCVCSTSNCMSKQVRSSYPSVKNLHITPFGIDVDIFYPKPELRDSNILKVGTLKKLAHTYGIDILIRAFAKVHNILKNTTPKLSGKLRLQIVGGGLDQLFLENLAKREGIGTLTDFVGWVPYAKVPEFLNSFDIYVATSRFESFGVSVLEASACGLPVVVSNVGGLPEIVKDQVTGLVVQRENIDETAESILRLIKDPSFRKQMGQEGRRHVVNNYNWEDSVSIMERIYRNVTQQKPL